MIRIPIARRSYPYLVAACCATAVAWWIHWLPGLLLAIPTLLLFNFFRDPERKTPALGPGCVIAPADGRVISIEPSPYKDFSDYLRISIFMNIFDVHVNRVPVTGSLRSMLHFPGSFLNADHPDASAENERMEFILLTDYGPVLICLVAGLIARRIVSWARPDDRLLRGQRFAMIKLGSRVDIHLPADCRILVQPGTRVKAGLSVIAEFAESESNEGDGSPR
ncbi:phosphatidylserine decarboxylase [bacterium]|nr:phosphatidylserine decarboxylase [candidate division CSSED10-310 bacterium]